MKKYRKEKIVLALIGEKEQMPEYLNAYSGCEGISVKYSLCPVGDRDKNKFEDGLRPILDDPEVSAVEIFLPPALTSEVAQGAIRNNKHVSLGSPPAADVESMLVLRDMAAVKGVILRINDPYVYYPPFRKARSMIMDGEIGEPSMIRIKTHRILHHYKDTRDPLSIILDNEVYKFPLTTYLLGDIIRVFAWIDTSTSRVGASHIIMWKYADEGRYGVMDITESPSPKKGKPSYQAEHAVEITGTDGYLWVRGGPGMDLKAPPILLYRHRRAYEIGGAEMECDWGVGLRNSIRHFSTILKGYGKKDGLIHGIDEAIRDLKVAAAAAESSREGKEIEL